MGVRLNPLSGNFDFTGSGGGGGSAFFAGEVATYADLPLDGTAALNSRWLVRNSSGTWPFPNYRQGGIYIRTSIIGSSRDNDYTLADTKLPDVFADSAFLLYDNSDSTRNLQFDLGSISTGTTRTLTAPNASGVIVLGNDSRIVNILKSGTSAGAFSGGAGGTIDLSGGNADATFGNGGAAGTINLSGGDAGNDGAGGGGSINLSGGSGDYGSGGSINLIGNEGAAGSINLSCATGNNGTGAGGSITATGFFNESGGWLNMSGGSEGPGGSINTSDDGGAINTRDAFIELGRSTVRTTLTGTATANRAISLPNASGTLALTSLVGASAELVIACSDETSNLTTGTAKVTFRMPYAMTLSSVRASVNTAPTGSTLVVDINEGGSTILSTKLSIDASELTSTTAATAAVISDTALADDASITIDIDQIGSTIAGKGLKVVLKGTRA